MVEEIGGKDAYSNIMDCSHSRDCSNEKVRTAQLVVSNLCGYDSGAGYDFNMSFIRGASQIENLSNFVLASSQLCSRIERLISSSFS